VNINNEESMDNQIEKTLKLKYKESFKVTDSSFDKGLNLYLFSAHPIDKPEIIFEGTYDEREDSEENKIDNDGYVNSKFSYEASVFYEEQFPNKELTHVAKTSVYSRYEHQFGNPLISWNEYLSERLDGSTIRNNTYFFSIPDGPYHQTVITLQAVIESLHMKYKNNFSVYVGFWPEGFLDDQDINELTFGFENTKMEDADNLLNVMQYLSKVLFIKIVNGSIASLTHEKLYELIKPHNKNGPDELVEI
jgi:hypothetical protein